MMYGGFQYDKGEMAAAAAKYEPCCVIAMHNQNGTHYEKDIDDINERIFLRELLRLPKKKDFLKKKIIIPGELALEKISS